MGHAARSAEHRGQDNVDIPNPHRAIFPELHSQASDRGGALN
jgi:hypothetical protein